MDILGGYDSGDEAVKPVSEYKASSVKVNAAPAVTMVSKVLPMVLRHDQSELKYNVTSDVLMAPMQGPLNPFKFNSSGPGKRSGMGSIEDTVVENYAFDEQYQTYQRSGFAVDISTNRILGSVDEFNSARGETAQTARGVKKAPGKRKRSALPEDIGDEMSGPWAPAPDVQTFVPVLTLTSGEEVTAGESTDNMASSDSSVKPGAAPDTVKVEDVPLDPTVHIVEPDEEAEMWEKVNERKMTFTLPPRPPRGSVAGPAQSTFHGKAEVDYQGRPWTFPPSGVRPEEEFGSHECFIPKKCIRKFTGHTRGVQAIEFFPRTGHLLLSGSMDCKCKIWDVYEDRNVRRTYMGHTEAVRSINMSNDGSKFLSSAFDRYVRLWDVETGQAVGTYTNRKMAYQVRFYPRDNNCFLMAASDNKIYQWDSRTGEIEQEYNYHLQPASTVTFFDEGRKFLSTSDDKKILVWEYGIPVPIKYIQDPAMHAVPYVAVHPSKAAFCGQSMDNSIVTYSCGEKVKLLRKRVFRGHVNSGYACQVDFSPNGQFVISGDGQGKLNVWDWRTTKSYRKFQAHDDGPCIGAAWHPLQPSWIATCGWDGLIKLWD